MWKWFLSPIRKLQFLFDRGAIKMNRSSRRTSKGTCTHVHRYSQSPVNVTVGLDDLWELISTDETNKYRRRRYRSLQYPRISGASREQHPSRLCPFALVRVCVCTFYTRVHMCGMRMYGFVQPRRRMRHEITMPGVVEDI